MNRFSTFIQRLRGYATQPCVEVDDLSYTYAKLLEEIESWEGRFDELNLSPGSVVGVHGDYSFTAVAALLALFARPAIAALIPRDRDVAHYLRDAHAAALLKVRPDGSYSWSSIGQPANHRLLNQVRAAGQGGVVIFTSGSTGRPKAALQSIESFLYKFRNPGRRFRTLALLAFDHVAGLDALLYTLSSGGTLILARRRDPESIMALVESHAVEVLPTSPSFLRLLCAVENDRQYDLSCLKVITYGAESMDPTTLARLNVRFPKAQISQKYGTTETGSPRTVSRSNGSLWLKIKSDGVETRVVDGVLWLRSEGVMLGYLNASSPIDADGWYCTGDLVDIDGEWIRFRGRAADIINVGGEKVSPAEVEQSVLELDFVRDAVVSGEPHALMGHVVTARVVLETPAMDLKDACKRIRLHCRERLAAYKVPVKIDIVLEPLTNDRHKVQRHRNAD